MKQRGEIDPLLQLIARYRSATDVHDVFGLILYTEEHPYVAKVLRDDDFWKALDTKSGKRWVIFSIRPEKGDVVTRFPKGDAGSWQMMVPIREWREPVHNRKLLSFFAIDDTQGLPLLLVFAQPTGGDPLRVIFGISGRSQDETYASLERAITIAAKAIKNVSPKNIKNTFEVFNLIDDAAKQEVAWQRVKSVGRLIPYVEKIREVLGGTK